MPLWTAACPRKGVSTYSNSSDATLAFQIAWQFSRFYGSRLTLLLPLILPATLAGNSLPTLDRLTPNAGQSHGLGPPIIPVPGEISRGLSKGQHTPAAGLGEHTEHLGFPTTLSVLTPGVTCSQPTLSMLQGGVTVPILVLREAKQLA